jgi:hypothetical protein
MDPDFKTLIDKTCEMTEVRGYRLLRLLPGSDHRITGTKNTPSHLEPRSKTHAAGTTRHTGGDIHFTKSTSKWFSDPSNNCNGGYYE